jgi:hypothetical protein
MLEQLYKTAGFSFCNAGDNRVVTTETRGYRLQVLLQELDLPCPC